MHLMKSLLVSRKRCCCAAGRRHPAIASSAGRSRPVRQGAPPLTLPLGRLSPSLSSKRRSRENGLAVKIAPMPPGPLTFSSVCVPPAHPVGFAACGSAPAPPSLNCRRLGVRRGSVNALVTGRNAGRCHDQRQRRLERQRITWRRRAGEARPAATSCVIPLVPHGVKHSQSMTWLNSLFEQRRRIPHRVGPPARVPPGPILSLQTVVVLSQSACRPRPRASEGREPGRAFDHRDEASPRPIAR